MKIPAVSGVIVKSGFDCQDYSQVDVLGAG